MRWCGGRARPLPPSGRLVTAASAEVGLAVQERQVPEGGGGGRLGVLHAPEKGNPSRWLVVWVDRQPYTSKRPVEPRFDLSTCSVGHGGSFDLVHADEAQKVWSLVVLLRRRRRPLLF